MKISCIISGIRKGVGDIGLLNNVNDIKLIEKIDEISDISSDICINKRDVFSE